jgi:hypothetical protein
MSTPAAWIAFGLAFALLGGNNALAADDNAKVKIEQKDFTDKIDDVRRAIERDRNAQPVDRNNLGTDQIVIDVCKKNPKLPQCL